MMIGKPLPQYELNVTAVYLIVINIKFSWPYVGNDLDEGRQSMIPEPVINDEGQSKLTPDPGSNDKGRPRLTPDSATNNEGRPTLTSNPATNDER